MPLLKIEELKKNFYLGIWKIEESLIELEEFYFLYLTQEYKKIHIESKKKQWLACRLLAMQMCRLTSKNFYGIKKNEFGKPLLMKLPFHISFSHTMNYAVTLLNIFPCGIDIERINLRIDRIKNKFLNEDELIFIKGDLKKKCIFWCAKEALYKWYGKKYISFKNHIQIKMLNGQILLGIIMIGKINLYKYLLVKRYTDHILVYTL